jgi:dihydrofolate reductase
VSLQLSLIAAIDRNNAIGKGNALPWHLPDDLKRFKALTLGKPLLMGRKTAESLGRALPGRRNIVLTRSGRAPFAGMDAVASLDAALEMIRDDSLGDQEIMVIGGGDVFALALPFASRMHLTYVDTVVADADAFFPEFDASQWRAVPHESHAADAKHAFAFEFVDYMRND